MGSPNKMKGNPTVSIAIPRPVDQVFTYSIEDADPDQFQIGNWVKVPFGRSVTHGYVVEEPKTISDEDLGFDFSKIRSVIEVGEPSKIIPREVYDLCQWTSQYYQSPLGEVLHAAAPPVVLGIGGVQGPRKKKKNGEENPDFLSSRNDVQLTEEQEQAVSTIQKIQDEKISPVVLLQGVTGSGKTEVYIRVARKVLDEDRAVLILVPEIALTPQLHQRIQAGIGVPVGLWHSAVSSGKRKKLWEDVRLGKIRVLVGARSAVFAPLKNLGMIVVDEEHDATYKQEDRVRYHARDLAIVRAKKRGLSGKSCSVILGSATPSLEALKLVGEKKGHKIEMQKRVGGGGLPEIELVNLCHEDRVLPAQSIIAQKTLTAIQKTLDAGDQVMVFLNRRGYSVFVVCEDCGFSFQCPNCSVTLKYYKGGATKGSMKCHLCGRNENLPTACPKCSGFQLRPMGAGTEGLEEDFCRHLKNARICRLDRDQVTSVGRLEAILESFRSGDRNLLLGTQMVVKGHDFPNVTLVVVLLADSLFRFPDFRASERAFQTMKQVVGRSGRGEKLGKVLIQTFDPEHPVLHVLMGRESEKDFVSNEESLRKTLGYPPYGRLVRIRFEAPSRKEAESQSKAFALDLGRSLPTTVQVLGPSEAFIEKIKNTYRWDLLVKSNQVGSLHQAIVRAKVFARKNRSTISFNVDPQGV